MVLLRIENGLDDCLPHFFARAVNLPPVMPCPLVRLRQVRYIHTDGAVFAPVEQESRALPREKPSAAPASNGTATPARTAMAPRKTSRFSNRIDTASGSFFQE